MIRAVPVRFTDDPAAAARFLEALGLERAVSSDGGGWIELRAGGGGVALHATATSEGGHRSGALELSFESDGPLEPVADRLRGAGFEPEILDEAWGRQLVVVDPDGVTVTVNQNSPDLYGYTRA